MPELDPPQDRQNPTGDPLQEHIKTCLDELLRTGTEVRARLRMCAAILAQFDRDEEENEEDSDVAVIELGGRVYRLNTRPGSSTFSDEELEVLERFIRNQALYDDYRRLTGWYRRRRRNSPTYELER